MGAAAGGAAAAQRDTMSKQSEVGQAPPRLSNRDMKDTLDKAKVDYSKCVERNELEARPGHSFPDCSLRLHRFTRALAGSSSLAWPLVP